jgi:hypothetical protein
VKNVKNLSVLLDVKNLSQNVKNVKNLSVLLDANLSQNVHPKALLLKRQRNADGFILKLRKTRSFMAGFSNKDGKKQNDLALAL